MKRTLFIITTLVGSTILGACEGYSEEETPSTQFPDQQELNEQVTSRAIPSRPQDKTLLAQANQTNIECRRRCLITINSGKTNRLGNPLLHVFGLGPQGTVQFHTYAVSGRADTKNAPNRDIPDKEYPLPDGTYSVEKVVRSPAIPEVGIGFIPIYPQFSTNRTELGFHYDPSYNKTNGEDGTAGCIATATPEGFRKIKRFVMKQRFFNNSLLLHVDI